MYNECEKVIKLLTMVIEEVEQGSLKFKGGQSRGWAVFHWLCNRYDVPKDMSDAIVYGYLRWVS